MRAATGEREQDAIRAFRVWLVEHYRDPQFQLVAQDLPIRFADWDQHPNAEFTVYIRVRLPDDAEPIELTWQPKDKHNVVLLGSP